MRYNGRDPCTLHRALSRAKEILPSYPALDIETIDTSAGSLLAHVSIVQDTYTLRMNVAAATYAEAMEARTALAEWAGSSRKQLALLEPTHMPGKAYNAIVKSISRLETRFGTVDVVFQLPRPVLYDVIQRSVTAEGTEAIVRISGSTGTQARLSIKLAEDAEDLVISADGYALFAIGGAISAGQTVETDMQTGAVLIDGEHAENRLIYTDMDPDVELLPGRHTITASASGTITARWHDQWL